LTFKRGKGLDNMQFFVLNGVPVFNKQNGHLIFMPVFLLPSFKGGIGFEFFDAPHKGILSRKGGGK